MSAKDQGQHSQDQDSQEQDNQDNQERSQEAGQDSQDNRPQQDQEATEAPQGNTAAIIAVVVLLIAAIALIWFLANDELDVEEFETDGTATEEAVDEEPDNPTIAGLLADNPDTFSTLSETARTQEDVMNQLEDAEAEYTLFAPTNEAFDEQEGELEAGLEYHLVEDVHTSEELIAMDGETLTTVEGSGLDVTVDEDGTLLLNDGVTVTEMDLEASNGVVHAIDGVLQP